MEHVRFKFMNLEQLQICNTTVLRLPNGEKVKSSRSLILEGTMERLRLLEFSDTRSDNSNPRLEEKEMDFSKILFFFLIQNLHSDLNLD